MVRTAFFPTLILTILCLSTMTLLSATALPTPINLARRQALLIPTLSLPPPHRRGLDAQELEAEAGVVIPPTISIRDVEAEAEANSKRALPRSPGGSRPGSGTYYPGQPYGRRDEVDDASS
ncbi:hypothetical protein BGZ91_010573 [Linnemannia elongata]|nr:hypothetical protein BGZ91_010573 [Linnemannia elongata]